MGKLPFFQFYPADWIQDTQHISLEAQGAWIKVLCALHISPERGKLTWSRQSWQNFLGYKTIDLLHELQGTADITRFDRDGQEAFDWDLTASITIISRRMVRDEAKQIQELERKRRYEDSHPTRRRRSPDVNPTDRLQTSDVRLREEKTRSKSQPSPEGRRSAQVLSDKIFENHPTRTAPTEAVLMEWSREADRIYKIDKHSWEEILSLIEWSQVDPFWKGNILSMSKFRKQWNQLTAHRSRGGEHEPKGTKGLDSLKDWSRRLPKP